MTRDEAIDKATLAHPNRTEARKFVDMAVALGVLKLDEQKSTNQRFDEALSGIVAREWRDRYWEIIHDAGLKIVEK